MTYQVIYFSRKGNTKKIAQAIASELKVTAEDVKHAKLLEDTFVFLGSGCYGGKPSQKITQFITDNTFESREVAIFGTSGSGEGKEVIEMENTLTSKKALIKGTYFCKGKFLFSNRGRPNDQDVKDAEKFAKRMVK
ncbi:MAG: flavodoxin family protein [Thermoplasmatota archaeon]